MRAQQVETDYEDCGTLAGWNKHRRDRTRTCDECKAAQTAYMRDYRARNMPGAQNEAVANRARGRAVWRLVALHPAQFQALVAEEMARDRAAP